MRLTLARRRQRRGKQPAVTEQAMDRATLELAAVEATQVMPGGSILQPAGESCGRRLQ
jgi:hypothetical protein